MAGLLDWMQTPEGIGLLSAVAGGMAGARRGQPINSMGRGLVTGLQGYAGAQDQIKQDQENALTQQYRSLQMQKIQDEIARSKSMKEAAQVAAEKSMIPGSHGPLGYRPTDPNAFTDQLAQGNAPEDIAFNQANVPAIAEGNNALAPTPPSHFDPTAYKGAMLEQLAQAGMPEEALKYAPAESKPMVLGKTLIDPATGKVIATDSTWQDEQKTARAQRIEELQMRLDDRRISQEQSMDLRRELAGQQEALRRDLAGQAAASRRDSIAQGNKPPSGYRYTPDGNLEQIPGGPADQKTQQRLEGGGTVDSVTASLRDSYNKLEENGGITSTNNRAGTNAGAWLGSTAIGQTAGSMFGTGNQKERDVIAQQRPLLLQAIMKSTGMSAKQMDSNAELKLYLATATDPTKSLQANRQALDMIEKLYGGGAGNNGNRPDPKDPATTPKAAAYKEYLDAFNRATPAQRKAINARARQNGVIK